MVSSQSSVSTLKEISFFKKILLKKRNFKDKKKSKEILKNLKKSKLFKSPNFCIILEFSFFYAPSAYLGNLVGNS